MCSPVSSRITSGSPTATLAWSLPDVERTPAVSNHVRLLLAFADNDRQQLDVAGHETPCLVRCGPLSLSSSRGHAFSPASREAAQFVVRFRTTKILKGPGRHAGAAGCIALRVGVLGTGAVGRAIAGKLMELGHDVVIGTRNVAKTIAHTEPDYMGNPPFSVWHKTHDKARLATFAEAAAHGELLVNATAGMASLDALRSAGERNLAGKILIDIANPLDFSKGMPPTLGVCNTDSLGEQIQLAFPRAKVVKTLNTMNNMIIVNPNLVANGDHNVFVSGNDAQAKAKVTELLKTIGWRHIIDLGDITTARGVEMVLPIWVRMMGALQTPMFNFKIAR